MEGGSLALLDLIQVQICSMTWNEAIRNDGIQFVDIFGMDLTG